MNLYFIAQIISLSSIYRDKDNGKRMLDILTNSTSHFQTIYNYIFVHSSYLQEILKQYNLLYIFHLFCQLDYIRNSLYNKYLFTQFRKRYSNDTLSFKNTITSIIWS